MRLGCFGNAVCFDLQEDICSSCKDNVSCFKEANTRLNEMSKDGKTYQSISTKHTRWGRKLGVDIIGTESMMLNLILTKQEESNIKALPKNAYKLAKSVLSRGYNLEQLWRNKQNPFQSEKPSYFYCIWSLILEQKQFVVGDLVVAFANAFPQWSISTIYSHVAVVTKVLTHFNVIESLGSKTYRVSYE